MAADRQVSSTRWTLVREKLRSSLWFTPSLFIAASIIAALSLEMLDREVGRTISGERLLIAFSGGPEAARAVLETIAGSILTLTGLVFSITMLVLQLTSTQYSPRALRTFLLDRTSKVTMGVFLGTFTFALLGLRAVRSSTDQGDPFVPGMLVSGAFVLTLASLYTFLIYIHHIAQRIQASSIIAAIAAESVETLDRMYPDEVGAESEQEPIAEPDEATAVILAPCSDSIVSVDEKGLVALASEWEVCFQLVHRVGAFVAEGQPLVRVYGRPPEDHGEVLEHVHFGDQRTMEQDLAFGFRQLIDVALRALSPSTNDPSTAVKSVDRIHDLLRRLGAREFPQPVHSDENGSVRLLMVPMTWEYFVRLASTEVVHYGAEHPQIAERLSAMYDDLTGTLSPGRAAVVRQVASQIAWRS
ncbi:MAG: DUF2254 domain-containing protein [Actinobacteria bacterium HGW-Actinobacteria-10]|jgi:uncharacterized membrane protein|nr:MAG: DUF2254 domain-containing protein [Actinobacteria bacterium HGW-Actinobacteria-10]